MTIKEEKTLDLFRGLHFCGWCCKPRICVPHHLLCRGMGGGSRLDVAINLIALCCECHATIQEEPDLRHAVLLRVAKREKTTPTRINAAIWALLRAPKGSDAQEIIHHYLKDEMP